MPRLKRSWPGRITRRELVANGAKMALALALYDGALRPLLQPAAKPPPVEPERSQRFGVTFSPLKASYMEMDYKAAFRDVLDLNLDFVRLGSYWSEIEAEKGQIVHFETLDWLLEETAKRGGTDVILTVGLKAPVYPEFHLPKWVWEEVDVPRAGTVSREPRLREYGLRFVQAVVERYADTGLIKCFQVENEPFDPVLYDYQTYRFLGEDFLRQEIALVRERDLLGRPILLNVFVETSALTNILANVETSALVRALISSAVGRRERDEALKLADIVGYDVYAAVGWDFLGRRFYIRSSRANDYNNLVAWREKAERAGKRAFIIEAQAEPWEPGSAVHIKQRDYPSFNPQGMTRFIDRLAGIGFRDICFWGVEHWVWHRQAGHPEWWEAATQILEKHRGA